MAKIIDFKDSPVKRIKQELNHKAEENAKLREELKKAHQKIGKLVSVNEMLKLQLADLTTNLKYFEGHLKSFSLNARKLKESLPDLNGYVRTPDHHVKVNVETESEQIDLSIADPNDSDDPKKD